MVMAITAATQSLMGEILQLLAAMAIGVLVMVLAVEADHGADRLLLAHQSGVVTGWLAKRGG